MCTHRPPARPRSLRPTDDDSPLSLAPCTLSLSPLAMGPTATLALYMRPLFHSYSGALSSPPPSLQNQYGGQRCKQEGRRRRPPLQQFCAQQEEGEGTVRMAIIDASSSLLSLFSMPIRSCYSNILIPTLQACTFSPSSLRDCLDYPRLTVDRFAGPPQFPPMERSDYFSGRDRRPN